MQDPPSEARRRAEEIYQRLMRELRSDLERRMRYSPPPEAPVDERHAASGRHAP